MIFPDPYRIICDKCNHKDDYRLDDVRSLVAKCTNCGHSLESVGERINAELNEHSRQLYFTEFILDLEDACSFEIEDREFDNWVYIGDVIDTFKAKSTNKGVDTESIVITKLQHYGIIDSCDNIKLIKIHDCDFKKKLTNALNGTKTVG